MHRIMEWDYGKTSYCAQEIIYSGIVRENITFIIMQNKSIIRSIIRIALATGFLLLIPLVAMQFTDEVVWTLTDFAVMGVLLLGSGLTYVLVSKMMDSTAYRVAVGIAVAAGLILIWINLAVGIIGNEDHPANLMYLGVLAVGLIGSIIVRLKPRGMARVLFATALVQALVPVIALIIWKPSFSEPPGVVGVFFLNAFFVMLFVGSALLFRHAAGVGNVSNSC